MTGGRRVRTVVGMGTNIYGSHDSLVIELQGLDRLRAGRREVRVPVDAVWRVRSAAPSTLVTLRGDRVLRTGWRPTAARSAPAVLVLDLLPGAAPYDRLVLAVRDADAVATELRRWGIGAAAAHLVDRTTTAPVLTA